ncbi:MAG TPA: DUF559 domain-containing protein, partial [Chitinophagaceae bacterium]|nr:DUF559 domain-containing protein [Chitinophagaceae bacterium]
VVKKKMRQWYLRITAYADRLLAGLEKVEFSESLKEQQRNWIGKSQGAEISFELRAASYGQTAATDGSQLVVYTTRPDTIFGADFMVIAPEHELVAKITTDGQKDAIDKYLDYVKSRSDRERMAEVKQITGCFTGAYAINPFDGREIPVWIAEYVLAGYGTGAIMAVPCGDQRDYDFAKHFNIPITNIIGDAFDGTTANPTKDAVLTNSGFLNGMVMRDAIDIVITKLVEKGIGRRQVNYKMRDAGFSRQRYWGEPFPIVWSAGEAYPLDEKELPLELPHVDKYGPGPMGEGPLANLTEWVHVPSPPAPLHGVERGASPQDILQNIAGGASGGDDHEEIIHAEEPVPRYNVRTPMQFELAKEMRKGHTEAEAVLWQELRNNNIGEKFRRQHPVDAYIVDFICLQKALIVEVDGAYHEDAEQKVYDEERTKVLNDIGFKVIRFTNDEVIKNTKTVIKQIEAAIKEQTNTQSKTNTQSGVSTPLTVTSKETSGGAPLATEGGEGPGVRGGLRETSTMPGYAGSSWYFLRYMDPHNDKTFCDRSVSDYWGQVDVYVGGTEHAVGHLLYSRMWTKVLFDLGYIGHDEPYKRLVNQGMITGSSRFVYRVDKLEYKSNTENLLKVELSKHNPLFTSYNRIKEFFTFYERMIIIDDSEESYQVLGKEIAERLKIVLDGSEQFSYSVSKIHVDVNIVDGVELNVEAFKKWKNGEYANADFIYEETGGGSPLYTAGGEGPGVRYICGVETEKMSKSKFNTVNPDDLVEKFGADTFRMYEMFLGPVEASKPWDTKGIEGVHRFLKKLWRLFYDEMKGRVWKDEKANPEELKILHRAIRKVEDDTERFSFNTAVSTFMICVNELNDIKCHKKEILEKVLILLTPYAPHIAEELWYQLGNTGSILDAVYPVFDAKHVAESSKEYPVSINGRVRTNISIALDISQPEVEQIVLANETVQKWLEGKPPKKIIYVKNKMVNVVV